MRYEDIWAELEAGEGAGAGHLVRRIHPESRTDLFLAVEKPGNRRILSLAVSPESSEDLDDLPAGRAIQSRLQHDPHADRTQLQLVLIDPMSADIFGVLVSDIAAAVAPSANDRDAVAHWVARLQRWQRLLSSLGAEGLSSERQRGLYAELWLLRKHLLEWLGAARAVTGWTGPRGASHDFELDRAAVEVKSTAGKQHQVLRIASERQLDGTGTEQLLLFHLSIDVRQGEGESLVDAVNDARDTLATTAAASVFEERLLLAGYAAAHEPRYRRTAYAIREQNFFQVVQGFPRLTETDLPIGVGDLRYSVAVSECRRFGVPLDDARRAVRVNVP